MVETLNNFYKIITLFDLIYLIVTVLSLIKCSKKGFVLSILAASKWLLAYVITLIAFPKIRPYFVDIIDSEYILDLILGIGIFLIIIFIILMINKGIGKAIKFSGLGAIDTVFGFFFGFLRSYIICVCLFSTATIVYNHTKWPMKLDESLTFSYVEKGSNYLIKEFPNEKNYKNTKEKIEEL